MADITPYVRTLYLKNLAKSGVFPGGYSRREVLVAKIKEGLDAHLEAYGVEGRIETAPLADQLFEEMFAASSFEELSDDFAGRYYKTAPSNIETFKASVLSRDPRNARADVIGEQRYFSDVFAAFIGGDTEEPLAAGLAIEIPASDRIVQLGHNQQEAIDPSLSALIEDVRSDNEILDSGLKERLLGQMRAGQELVRAGSVRAYLLYHTLVRGLLELIARYRGRAIAIAAEKLVELLIEHIFIES